MDLIIKEVVSKCELKKFVSFPRTLYSGHKYWIPLLQFDEMGTLQKHKNPAFSHCEATYWLAYKDRKVVGRIAGIINNRYFEKWNNKYARFGWVDFIDDESVSAALFKTVENWAKQKGMEAIHGPLGFTDLDPEGMLIEGFEELGTIATIYNYPYYPEHIEKYGYKKDVDWIEFEIKIPEKIPEKIERIAEIVKKKKKLTVVKTKKRKDVLLYAKEIFHVLNQAYDSLYGFVPLTEKQIDKYVKQYLGYVRPDFVSIILDEQKRVAAFGISIPSLSKALQKAKGRIFPFGFLHILKAMRKNDRIDLFLVAVRQDLQGKGLNSLLFNELHKTYIKNNITKAESNPELESNTKVQAQWKLFEKRQHKRRRCYIKHFE
jgi:GNAT superfamily N-acetyltransferase